LKGKGVTVPERDNLGKRISFYEKAPNFSASFQRCDSWFYDAVGG